MVTERIKALLQEGLDLYGFGKIKEAIEKWKEVLELDPGNILAMDYLHSAGVDLDKLFEKGEEEREEVVPLLKSGKFLEAYEAVVHGEKDSLYKICIAELITYHLTHYLKEKYGRKGVVPRPLVKQKDLLKKALTPTDAFIASQIDGRISVEDLLDIVNISELELFMSLARLEREGVIEI